MFFNYKMPPGEDTLNGRAGSEGKTSGIEMNSAGEPLYIQGPEGELVINDPSLLLSKETHKEPPLKEDIDSTLVLTNIGWIPCSQIPRYATQ